MDRQPNNPKLIRIYSGDCYASNEKGETLMTILGSCISACIHDPIKKIGGMNHFLLPTTGDSSLSINDAAATRYGLFAMERLINELLKYGADKSRLEIKIFGGANVIENSALIGDKNIEFIRNFLERDGYKIHSEDVGGKIARRVHYFPDIGKAMVKIVEDRHSVANEEKAYVKTFAVKEIEGDIELF